ncbi:hypothetical protein, partial [Xanthomonas citri]|uniref:hypothetical protein n=1 Tax=Xanthomonas citri TaxID=346 RepID=UPI0040483961
GGDQGYIFLGGCNAGLRYTPIRLAKDFNTSVISTVWHVRRSESSSGEITYTPNTKLDGTGSEGFFNLTRPDGTSSGKIASITMRADGKIKFRGAEAPTGSHIKPKITIDPEDR